MNCCSGNHNGHSGNHNDHNGNQNGGGPGPKRGAHLSHMLMMALCCGAPILILALVPFIIRIGGTGTAAFLSAAAPFICPLMMIFMLPMMLKGFKGEKKEEYHQQPKPLLEEKVREE